MTVLDAPAVAQLLVEIGQRLSLAGENRYKARSYARAAQSLMSLTVPLEEVVASDRLREIPGIGTALAETITCTSTGRPRGLKRCERSFRPGCYPYPVFQ